MGYFFFFYTLATLMISWVQISTGLLLYAFVVIHQVGLLFFDNYQRCSVPLSALTKERTKWCFFENVWIVCVFLPLCLIYWIFFLVQFVVGKFRRGRFDEYEKWGKDRGARHQGCGKLFINLHLLNWNIYTILKSGWKYNWSVKV